MIEKLFVIGNLDELSAATPADAQKFYQTFYRPDNAYLIVVGDFQQAQFDAWVDRYFGRIAKPAGEIPRVTVTEPDWKRERRFTDGGPNVPFPAVALTWLGPTSKSADSPALRVAETIMSGGESSRLNISLIRDQKIAQAAEFSLENRIDRGLLILYAIASEEGTADKIEKSLLAELAKIQQTPVLAKELAKAKNQLISNAIRERETNDGRASTVEQAIAYLGDPAAVNSEVAQLQAVTAADVQRVMRKYFGADRVVIYYQQGGGDADKK